MTAGPRHLRFEDLPPTLPVFPLAGALLLPRGKLPLNIFEPRYLAMVEDALAGPRIIGMIQPKAGQSVAPGESPKLYPTGCAGRVTSFAETEDGRYLITLTGLSRFDVAGELAGVRGYRRVEADFAPYREDLAVAAAGGLDRPRLILALKRYVALFGLSVDWDALDGTDNDRLITALAMICPFEAGEKQALLMAPDPAERGRLVTALIEMAVLSGTGEAGESARH